MLDEWGAERACAGGLGGPESRGMGCAGEAVKAARRVLGGSESSGRRRRGGGGRDFPSVLCGE